LIEKKESGLVEALRTFLKNFEQFGQNSFLFFKDKQFTDQFARARV
jgi:hypothetical protein